MPLPRVLEPEVMDTPHEAAEYDAMNHSAVNQKFVDDLLAAGAVGDDILDLGTGTGLIPIRLCKSHATCRIMAVDAATSMLDLARFHLEVEGLTQRIHLRHQDAKRLPMDDAMFDVVMSNSLIHHLPDPKESLSEIDRLVKPSGRVFIRDLYRPDTQQQVDALVELYTQGETDEARQLFRQSLHAALTLQEIQDLVSSLGYSPDTVAMTSDRHWTWSAVKPS